MGGKQKGKGDNEEQEVKVEGDKSTKRRRQGQFGSEHKEIEKMHSQRATQKTNRQLRKETRPTLREERRMERGDCEE